MQCLAARGKISRFWTAARSLATGPILGAPLLFVAGLLLVTGGCEEHNLPSASSTNAASGDESIPAPGALNSAEPATTTQTEKSVAGSSSPGANPVEKSTASKENPGAGKGNPGVGTGKLGAGTSVTHLAPTPTMPPSTSKSRRLAKGETQNISFDTIKLELVPGQKYESKLLTDGVRAIDKQKVRIRGYINPLRSFYEELTVFILARDNGTCCFGPNAMLCDFMVVQMAPGESAQFTTSPVTVEGEFSIQEQLDPDGNHAAIYSLVGESVR